MDWGKKWLVGFNAGKAQLVSFHQSNNTGSIDSLIKRVLQENWSLNSFHEVYFSSGCSLSLQVYHTLMYGKLLSRLGWCVIFFSMPCSDCSALHGVNPN